MRIEYYDADTHDLVRRDAYSQALVNALRERDEARAEVERLTNELNAALNQIDRGAFPDWTCAECGSQAGFDEVRYEAGDADMACRTCGGTDVRESAREAAGALGDKYDALKAEVERLRHAADAIAQGGPGAVVLPKADVERLREAENVVQTYGQPGGIDYYRQRRDDAECRAMQAAHALESERDRVRKLEIELASTRSAPAVYTTDIEAASYDVCAANYPGGIDSDRAEEVLRKHTRAVSVESVAQALYESAAPRTVHDWPLASGVTKETYIVQARAALRAIGARLAEPAAQPAKPREGFVVDRDRFNGIANRAGLAVARAIDECIAEIERQRAEFERRGGR